MGSFTSRHFEEMVEEMVPPTPTSERRPVELAFDPRSPTQGISRTPIQVEKTPVRMVDPRSPTVGITRTPLFQKDKRGSKLSMTRSRSYSEGLDIMDEICPALDPTAALPPLHLDLDEEVKVITRSNSEPDLSAAEGVHVASTKAECEPEKRKAPRAAKTPSSGFLVHSDVAPERSPKPKNIRQSPIQSLTAQRSPLGRRNVDVNSPRNIVQRKQTHKLGLLKARENTPVKAPMSPCRFEALTQEDKENMSL